MSRVAKQFVLVGVAVAVGAFVLGFALDDGPPSTAPAPDPTPAAEVSTPVPTPPGPAGRDPATVPVLVANSTDVPGLAGETSTAIGGLGYTMLTPVDSTGPQLDLTTVFAVPEAVPAAEDIAAALQLEVTAVLPMPAQPPVTDLGGAEVLVVVGLDLAPTG